MPNLHVIAGIGETPSYPNVRRITLADVREALARGFDDFSAMPTHVLFLGILYPVVGLLLFWLTVGYDIMPLLFPLASGFALIGPFAAVGLYELSRRREEGMQVTWFDAMGVFRSPAIGSILGMGAVLLVLFFAWLAVAWQIYLATLGGSPPQTIG